MEFRVELELRKAIARRASVRCFAPSPVPKQSVRDLVRTCYLAPSAGDIHPYRVVVVSDEKRRSALADACFGQRFVAEAPISIVFFVDLAPSGRRYGSRGTELYCLLDVGAAVENLMLAAVDAGLGTCWVGAFDEAAVGALLEAPPNWRAVTVVPLGKASGAVRHRAAPLLRDMLYSESCHRKWTRD